MRTRALAFVVVVLVASTVGPDAAVAVPPQPPANVTAVVVANPPNVTVTWSDSTGGGAPTAWYLSLVPADGGTTRTDVVPAATRTASVSCLRGVVPYTLHVGGVNADGLGPPVIGPTVELPPRPDVGRWLRSAYLATTTREPTEAELGPLDAAVQECRVSRLAVAAQLFAHEETRRVQTELLYLSALGRPADPDGLAFWSTNITEIEVLTTAALWGSAEAVNRHPDMAAWLDAVYQRFLGRPADDVARAAWLRRGPSGAGSIVLEILQSEEGVRRRVDTLYRALLGRPADVGGLATWLPVMRDAGDFDVAIALVASDEFYHLVNR